MPVPREEEVKTRVNPHQSLPPPTSSALAPHTLIDAPGVGMPDSESSDPQRRNCLPPKYRDYGRRVMEETAIQKTLRCF
ncbi:hypothetical protein CEXT_181341 [Caerostris extrusa]|uniref:Uncharacterized protein n=1 Tax=Caerostris extrusa TaxID=172846 RepID=A0AAV4T512_CAEEX|nr:hypothetical protein CEXT_181341 [Caerostris extrusa]